MLFGRFEARVFGEKNSRATKNFSPSSYLIKHDSQKLWSSDTEHTHLDFFPKLEILGLRLTAGELGSFGK